MNYERRNSFNKAKHNPDLAEQSRLSRAADELLNKKKQLKRKLRQHKNRVNKAFPAWIPPVKIKHAGPPCPMCTQPTELRMHKKITDKLKAQPYYYQQWSVCRNKDCSTDLIFDERYKVYNDTVKGKRALARDEAKLKAKELT
jgi:hypothetical protein